MNDTTITEHKYQFLTLWIVYCSYLLTIPAIIGAVVNWVEINRAGPTRDDSRSEYDSTFKIVDSHHRWLLRTFIFCFPWRLSALRIMAWDISLALSPSCGGFTGF